MTVESIRTLIDAAVNTEIKINDPCINNCNSKNVTEVSITLGAHLKQSALQQKSQIQAIVLIIFYFNHPKANHSFELHLTSITITQARAAEPQSKAAKTPPMTPFSPARPEQLHIFQPLTKKARNIRPRDFSLLTAHIAIDLAINIGVVLILKTITKHGDTHECKKTPYRQRTCLRSG